MGTETIDASEIHLLAEAIDADPMACAVYSAEGRLVRCNQAYRDLNRLAFAGLPKDLERKDVTYEALMRSRAQQTLSPDQVEAYVVERLKEHFSGDGAGADREITGKGWFRIFKFKMPSGAVLTRCVDITELKIHEIELAATQKVAEATNRRMQAALEVMEDGFAIYDSDDRLVVCNSAMRRMHEKIADALVPGLTYEEGLRLGLKRGMWDIGDADPDEWVARIMEDRAASKTFESVVRFSDGRWMRRLEATTPDGERVGIRTDITKMKLREAELRDAREKTEQAARAKSEFLANMSHEIRTPMNGILGMAELLISTDLDNRQAQFASTIHKSGNALITIINDILDFSKIDSGQLQLDAQPFDVKEAAEDVAALLSSTADDKGLELAIKLNPALPGQLVGDASRIRQILTNLIGNAVKFTDKGHVLVDVGGARNGPMWNLNIEVQDTGIGIPDDKIDRVFEKFSQVDGSATRRHEGTGLGLSIAKLLVERMNGEIGVRSKLGEGSTFWVSLPLVVAEGEAAVPGPDVDIAGSKMLVVDDNDVNRSILQEQLSSWGVNVDVRPSGWEGLSALTDAAAAGEPFDLMVLDQQMPHLSGEDVLSILKGQEKIADTLVVMLTSVGQPGDAKQWREQGASGFLVKPARSQQLLDALVTSLQSRDMLRPMPEREAEAVAPGEPAEMEPEPAGIVETEAPAPADVPALEVPDTSSAEVVPAGSPITMLSVLDEVLSQEHSPVLTAEEESTEAEPAEVERDTEARAKSSVQPPTDAGEPYILVAEDNDTNQMFMEFVLGDMGYELKIAGDGQIAFDCYRERRPALIFMDISMPNMDGMEATAQIRQYEAENGLSPAPIIAVTAHALKGDAESFLSAGMDDYLSKPVAPSKIAEILNKWLPAELSLAAPQLA